MKQNNIHTGFLQLAALLGCLDVLFGAYGTHGLSARLSPGALQVYEVGVRYQMYHVFALALTALLFMAPGSHHSRLRWAGWSFIIGIILFSGSLYGLSFALGAGNPTFMKLGMITPVGGFFLIAGWILLIFSVGKSKSSAAVQN